MKNQLIKKIKITTILNLTTGLHIGGSSDNVEIGGIDKTIIRRSKDNVPYIPGSSLKGKIRSLLEQIAGCSEVGGNMDINDLFGFAKENKPSKLIVRDSYMTKESKKLLEESEYLDLPYTEVKFENTILRDTGTATNPRKIERIPGGVAFNVEFIINVWDNDVDGKKSYDLLLKGIEALKNDYLGGSGSRGYGQVSFGELHIDEISFEKYFVDEN